MKIKKILQEDGSLLQNKIGNMGLNEVEARYLALLKKKKTNELPLTEEETKLLKE